MQADNDDNSDNDDNDDMRTSQPFNQGHAALIPQQRGLKQQCAQLRALGQSLAQRTPSAALDSVVRQLQHLLTTRILGPLSLENMARAGTQLRRARAERHTSKWGLNATARAMATMPSS